MFVVSAQCVSLVFAMDIYPSSYVVFLFPFVYYDHLFFQDLHHIVRVRVILSYLFAESIRMAAT